MIERVVYGSVDCVLLEEKRRQNALEVRLWSEYENCIEFGRKIILVKKKLIILINFLNIQNTIFKIKILTSLTFKKSSIYNLIFFVLLTYYSIILTSFAKESLPNWLLKIRTIGRRFLWRAKQKKKKVNKSLSFFSLSKLSYQKNFFKIYIFKKSLDLYIWINWVKLED